MSPTRNPAAARTALAKLTTYQHEAHQADLRRLLESDNPEFDTETVLLLSQQPHTSSSQELYTWGAVLGKRMGQIPLQDGRPVEHADSLSATTGEVERNGLKLRVDFLMFKRPEMGLPAFTAYLCKQGFADLKYLLVDFDEVRGD